MPIAYQFLPWVRRGLAVALDVPDNLGVGAPLAARGSAEVGVKLVAPHDGTAIAPVPMRLHGPGDVIGIDQRLVVRTDPKPNATNFEPNYLPIVDFDPPDFPWMLTPAKAQDDRRLRPWLVLIVLEVAKTGLPRMSTGGVLPSIRIKGADVASELPDLADSWSWAHAQLVNEDAGQIQADLQGKPNSNISRLVCPRRLKELTDYVACVVPAFEPGRLRGLGLVPNENDPKMTTLAPAWNKSVAADVTLPVYYHWEFSTSPKGDFESLARRLRTPGSYKGTPVEEQLKTVGTIPMEVDNLLNGSTPGLVTTMEGALVPIKYEPGKPPPDVQAESLEIIVNTPQDQVANPVGNGPTNAEGRRIEVKPPMYGAWHAQQHQVFRAGVGPASAPKLGKHWLADLNLNPRYRGAAGLWRRGRSQEPGRLRRRELGSDRRHPRRRDEVQPDASRDRGVGCAQAQALRRAAARARAAGVRPRASAHRSARQRGADVSHQRTDRVASAAGSPDRACRSAMVDTAMRRVASPANRSLRMAARLNASVATLPTVLNSYVTDDGEGDEEGGRLFRQRLHAGRHHRHEAVRRRWTSAARRRRRSISRPSA